MNVYEKMANLIFPDVTGTIEELEKRFPPRDLKEGAFVTRFAPSPTGFLHTGSLFTALVARTAAKSTGGVYYFRLEDTDQKREIAGSGQELVDQLKIFGVVQDEGYFGDHDEGIYGPYVQSKRADIYKIVIKHLLEKNLAYPCFCSAEDLDLLRKTQEASKVTPGYYGGYAKCRFYTPEEAMAKIENGEKFVIRFRSSGNHLNYIRVHDLVRGDLNLSENDQDIVILKSDGLPTYHFAHLCDDHFMRTNLVTRGEEWLSSLPIHLELFNSLGWKAPDYAHLPVIMKLDNGNKRKLSKRKDNEAAVSFFLKEGYPIEGILKYLMTIANSNFEEWLLANPKGNINDFAFSFNKMSLDGALFDLPKLANISKGVLANMTKEEITKETINYAKLNDENLLNLINSDVNKFMSIMNIEREKENPRKDYEKYSDIFGKIKFFYNEFYEQLLSSTELSWNQFISKEDRDSILKQFAETLDLTQDESSWFNKLKELAIEHGFADNFKTYKKNPENYKGHVGDIAELIRIAVSTSKQTPNLYAVLSILGLEEVKRRIALAIDK